ncbi:MAG: cytochrome c oxidase subunit II, partial [Bacteroidia bacterium]|nr:cytochrome c oxidase subunit II [Bacteroidia bacterium]
ETVDMLLMGVKVLVLIVVVLVIVLARQAVKLSGTTPFADWKSNQINPVLLLIFMVTGIGGVVYELVHHGKFILPPSASEHGKSIDTMFWITVILTGIVFIITQIALFTFSYLFRKREGSKAVFWADNHQLERIWTIVPAIALTFLVIMGYNAWTEYHTHPGKKGAVQIELVAEQFQWRLRYAGADDSLGTSNYRLIGGANALGLDIKNPASHDDIIPSAKEIHLPVNRPVIVNVRSKDVLHGMYMPHFRTHIYAVPGLPTQVYFKPIATTKEMRKKLGNDKFNYELACSQLCGSAHYNMRMVIIVETEEEYNAWLAQQKPWFTPEVQKSIEEMEAEKAKKVTMALN